MNRGIAVSHVSAAELRCVIPAKAGIQSPRTRGQVWMPAFAGMTLTFLSHPPILNDSRDRAFLLRIACRTLQLLVYV